MQRSAARKQGRSRAPVLRIKPAVVIDFEERVRAIMRDGPRASRPIQEIVEGNRPPFGKAPLRLVEMRLADRPKEQALAIRDAIETLIHTLWGRNTAA